MKNDKALTQVKVGTYKELSYRDLKPNPQNPRRLFDRGPLEVLEESIRANGILVPLTVYLEGRNNQYYILDGERRWRCAEAIETDATAPKRVRIPANVVDPPTPVANILWMFNIHNLREQWELMPAALSLRIVMDQMGEKDDSNLAQLTKLSEPNVKRCKILLSYDKKYQDRMLLPDSRRRIKANFFIELYPVLELYMKLSKAARGGKTRDELIEHFLSLYESRTIRSVIHFRRVLEAYDFIHQAGAVDGFKEERFIEKAQLLATSKKYTIRHLFDPLTAEDKSIETAEESCREFLNNMRRLKVEHAGKRSRLRKALLAVKIYVDETLTQLEG